MGAALDAPAPRVGGRALRALALLAALAAAAALAVAIAYWAWMLLAPAPVHLWPAAPADPAGAIVAARLFGAPAATPDNPAVAATDTLGDVRLLGVMAAPDGGGYALFRTAAGPVFAAPGAEVVPGVRLARVQIDAVVLRDGSGERRLALPSWARAGAAPKSAPQPPVVLRAPQNVAAGAPACQPPAGFRGEVVRLNVELVGGLIAQPEVWRSLVEPAGGALVVRETAGFAQMVGLQQGDRLEQANGIALTVPDDIVGAVLRPLASNQPVHLVGKRGGQARELWVANAGCGR